MEIDEGSSSSTQHLTDVSVLIDSIRVASGQIWQALTSFTNVRLPSWPAADCELDIESGTCSRFTIRSCNCPVGRYGGDVWHSVESVRLFWQQTKPSWYMKIHTFHDVLMWWCVTVELHGKLAGLKWTTIQHKNIVKLNSGSIELVGVLDTGTVVKSAGWNIIVLVRDGYACSQKTFSLRKWNFSVTLTRRMHSRSNLEKQSHTQSTVLTSMERSTRDTCE